MGLRRVRYRGRRRSELDFAPHLVAYNWKLVAYNWKRSLSLTPAA